MSLVSIIVPVYNVDRFLERCLDSLCSQTLDDIEIILVNDGSIDSSASICEKYARKDTRIKVIHKENGGVSSARNVGLNIATGYYIGFIDPDDWIENTMFYEMIQNANKNNSDLVVCNYQSVYSNGNVETGKTDINDETIIDVANIGYKRYILDDFIKFKHGYSIWNKIYKRDLIQKYNIRFQPDSEVCGEDFLFNLYYLCHTNRISTIPKVYVNYFQRDDSLSSYPENLINRMTELVKRYEVYLNKYNLPRSLIAPVFCAQIYAALEHLCNSCDSGYIDRCTIKLSSNSNFVSYGIKVLKDKESENYLRYKGYRYTGRLYFKFLIVLMIFDLNYILKKRLMKRCE